MFRSDERERGAVSAFLIMIFAAVFAFVALFVDYGRMAALQAQTEASLHAGIRSVLSAYDPELLEDYGLFAVGPTDSSYILTRVLQEGFEHSERQNKFTLMGAKLDSSELALTRPLGTYPVFEQQIREQMKYKAPINLVLELLNKFKPASAVMKEASNTMDVLKKLQKLYDQREKLIDKVFAGQKSAFNEIKDAGRFISNNGALNPGSGLGDSMDDAGDAANQYGDYISKLAADEQQKPEDKLYTFELYRYRAGVNRVFSDLYDAAQTASLSHQNLLQNSTNWIKEAVELNGQMEQVIREAEERSEVAYYEAVGDAPNTGQAGSSQLNGSTEIKQIREQTRSLLRDNRFFEDLSLSVNRQKESFKPVLGAVNELAGIQGSVISGTMDSGEFYSTVIRAAESVNRYTAQVSGDLDQEEGKIMEQRARENEIKATEDAAKGKLSEAKNLITRLANLKDEMKEQQRVFDDLQSSYKDNLKLNTEAEEAAAPEDQEDEDDIYRTGDTSMKGMDQLYGRFSSLLGQITDNALEAEYTSEYFQAFDVTKLAGWLEESGSEISAEPFSPNRQEIEYILYGFHNPGGNLAAAFSEIFAMRLAIRTMEGFIVNANKGHPLLILASALLYGAEQAVADMLKLVKTGSIPLSKYINVPLTYKDHLRLFLLLHGSTNKRLSRMLALIRMNTGINPDERATYVEGKVSASMQLLFLPGIAAAMGNVYPRQGDIEGSSYFAFKNAAGSY